MKRAASRGDAAGMASSGARRVIALGALWLACALGACDAPPTEDAGARDGGLAADAGAAMDAGGALDADVIDDDAGEGDAGPDAAAPRAIATVLTLNLHCLELDGTAYATHQARLAAVAALVAREAVDVLLLQEVCDDGAFDAAEALGRALEEAGAGTFARHVSFAHLAWEGTSREARESVAVFSRELSAPATLAHRTQDGLRRVMVSASAGTPLGVLRVASVHFDHRSAAARLAQAREAAAITLAEADPHLAAVVGGDVNAPRGSDAHAAFGQLGYLDASDAAGGGRIDHVFSHRAAPLRALEARRVLDDPATRVSDHPGVLVRFVAAAPDDVLVTRVLARHDPGPGRALYVRGSAPPLSWTRGWPMRPRAAGEWSFIATELAGAVELKVLVDDVDWQLGENARVEAGGALELTPTF